MDEAAPAPKPKIQEKQRVEDEILATLNRDNVLLNVDGTEKEVEIPIDKTKKVPSKWDQFLDPEDEEKNSVKDCPH